MKAVDRPVVKVMLVDSHEVIRESLGMLFYHETQVDLVAVLSNGQQAIALVEVVRPDVVIMDIKLPGMSGIAAAEKIRTVHPTVGIIILSTYENMDYVKAFFNGDPSGKAFLRKRIIGALEDFVNIIREISNGGSFIDPILVNRNAAQNLPSGWFPAPFISPREIEVIKLLVKGYSMRSIASELQLQPLTVDYIIEIIYSKLNMTYEEGRDTRIFAALARLS